MKYNAYTPVDPDFYEIMGPLFAKGAELKVFYFNPTMGIEESKGISGGIDKYGDGEFLLVGNDNVRIDRIITINGKPGPAYEEYDAFANACLSCQAGYDD